MTFKEIEKKHSTKAKMLLILHLLLAELIEIIRNPEKTKTDSKITKS